MKVDRSDVHILKFLAPKVRDKMGYMVNRNGFMEHKGREGFLLESFCVVRKNKLF